MAYPGRLTLSLAFLTITLVVTALRLTALPGSVIAALYGLNYLSFIALALREYVAGRRGQAGLQRGSFAETALYVAAMLVLNLIVGVNFGMLLGLPK